MIFDSGAKIGISFGKNDFVSPVRPLSNYKDGGLANKMEITGIGTVKWKFRTRTSVITIVSSTYYAKKIKARLLGSQRLSHTEKGVLGRFVIEEDKATLVLDYLAELYID